MNGYASNSSVKKKADRRGKRQHRKKKDVATLRGGPSRARGNEPSGDFTVNAKSYAGQQRVSGWLAVAVACATLAMLWLVATTEWALHIVSGTLGALSLVAQLAPSSALATRLGFGRLSNPQIEYAFAAYCRGLTIVALGAIGLTFFGTLFLSRIISLVYGGLSAVLTLWLALALGLAVNRDLRQSSGLRAILTTTGGLLFLLAVVVGGFSIMGSGGRAQSLFELAQNRSPTVHDGILHRASTLDDYAVSYQVWIQASNDFLAVYSSDVRANASDPFLPSAWCEHEFPMQVPASLVRSSPLLAAPIDATSSVNLVGCAELAANLELRADADSLYELARRYSVGREADLLETFQSRWGSLTSRIDPATLEHRREALKRLWVDDRYALRATFSSASVLILRPFESTIARSAANSRLLLTTAANVLIDRYHPIGHTLLIACLLALSSVVARASSRFNESLEPGSASKAGHFLLSATSVFSFALFFWAFIR